MHRFALPAAALRGLIAVLVALLAPPLAAQEAGRAAVPEVRATLPLTDWEAAELGAGVNLRAGWYVRLSAAVLGGAVRDDSALVGTGRAELAMRFHLDPFNQAPGCGDGASGRICRGLYGGLGVSQRWLGSGLGAEDPVFVVLVGLEGDAAPRRRLVWAVELALGGGVRLGATARWRRADGFR